MARSGVLGCVLGSALPWKHGITCGSACTDQTESPKQPIISYFHMQLIFLFRGNASLLSYEPGLYYTVPQNPTQLPSIETQVWIRCWNSSCLAILAGVCVGWEGRSGGINGSILSQKSVQVPGRALVILGTTTTPLSLCDYVCPLTFPQLPCSICLTHASLM